MNKSFFNSCLVTLVLCFLLYKLLVNRTVEIEKFSNDPIIYQNNGNELKYYNKNI